VTHILSLIGYPGYFDTQHEGRCMVVEDLGMVVAFAR
jgi:hypothetical protein